MKARPFKFKQFTIEQDRCAMKVGTDGVLMGAWASVEHDPQHVLDVGSGTGLVGLMIAQRCPGAFVDALEVQDDAFEQSVSNFEASPWADRLYCYHASLQEFAREVEDPYDLIVSNPPFHSETASSGDLARDLARQNRTLPFPELLLGAQKLLAPEGRFTVILPHRKASDFADLAGGSGLYLSRVLEVRGNPRSKVIRSLLEFQFGQTECITEQLIIENARHDYTRAYRELTCEFYLKM